MSDKLLERVRAREQGKIRPEPSKPAKKTRKRSFAETEPAPDGSGG